MTRRSSGLEQVNIAPDDWEQMGSSIVKNKAGITIESVDFLELFTNNPKITCHPRYKVGELLYLKEPTAIMKTYSSGGDLSPTETLVYRYDHQYDDDKIKWSNKLFMPAAAARAFIKITDIKCERLLDISNEDCISEGILPFEDGYILYTMAEHGLYLKCDTPKQSFLSLYRTANKIKGVEIPNIWVFAYYFEYLPGYKP